MEKSILVQLSPATDKFSQYQLLQLFIDDCFAMVLPLLGLSSLYLDTSGILSLSDHSVLSYIYFWMLRLLFKIFVFILTKPTRLLSRYNLWVLDLEYKFPCVMRGFLIFTSMSSVSLSFFVHLAIPTADLVTRRAHILFFPLSWFFTTCLVLW